MFEVVNTNCKECVNFKQKNIDSNELLAHLTGLEKARKEKCIMNCKNSCIYQDIPSLTEKCLNMKIEVEEDENNN